MQRIITASEDGETLVAPGEVIELRFSGKHAALSLRASKLLHLLVDHTGQYACEDREHSVQIADLNFSHLAAEDLLDAIRELQRTVVELKYVGAEGEPRVKSASLLAYVDRAEQLSTTQGVLGYKLSEVLREILTNSNHWAALSRDAVLAFESRYALRLYELVALRANLKHKNRETFELEDLRRRLGVPNGKLSGWADVRRKALEPAIAEVNQLSGLTVSYEAERRGRRVDRVTLSWSQGDAQGRGKAAAELARSSVGRKVRREGNEDTIASSPPHIGRTAFPEAGGIKHGKDRLVWLEIAEKHAQRLPGGHLPDLGGLAGAFRDWCMSKGIPLDAPGIEKTFTGFCQKYRPLMSQL